MINTASLERKAFKLFRDAVQLQKPESYFAIRGKGSVEVVNQIATVHSSLKGEGNVEKTLPKFGGVSRRAVKASPIR